jgi:hypothetical protein
VSWDGPVLNINTHSGERMSICFTPERVVGAGYDVHSRRSPFGRHYKPFMGDRYDPLAFFVGAPEDVVVLAREKPLQYLLDDFNGIVKPFVTAAFWSEGDWLTAAEPWPLVLEHGAHVLRIQLMEPETALAEWQENYGFSDAQVSLPKALFDRRIAKPTGRVALNDAERRMLTADGVAGLDYTRELLAAIGVDF